MNINSLRNKQVTRLGYPMGPGGALYYVTSEEGLIQMAADLECFRLFQNGIIVTSTQKSLLLDKAKLECDISKRKMIKYGIPDKIQKLLEITKKSRIEKFCKNLIISEFELFLFIQNCQLIGFSHKSKFPDFVPRHLKILESDKTEFETGDPSRVSKKIFTLLQERKVINVHIFERALEWHCFYYSYADIEETNNHWKFGEHIHYINSICQYWTKEELWNSFDERKTNLSGDFHIKFLPYKYPQIGDQKKENKNMSNVAQSLFSFNQTKNIENMSYPIPLAQIATRGCLISKVSI